MVCQSVFLEPVRRADGRPAAPSRPPRRSGNGGCPPEATSGCLAAWPGEQATGRAGPGDHGIARMGSKPASSSPRIVTLRRSVVIGTRCRAKGLAPIGFRPQLLDAVQTACPRARNDTAAPTSRRERSNWSVTRSRPLPRIRPSWTTSTCRPPSSDSGLYLRCGRDAARTSRGTACRRLGWLVFMVAGPLNFAGHGASPWAAPSEHRVDQRCCRGSSKHDQAEQQGQEGHDRQQPPLFCSP